MSKHSIVILVLVMLVLSASAYAENLGAYNATLIVNEYSVVGDINNRGQVALEYYNPDKPEYRVYASYFFNNAVHKVRTDYEVCFANSINERGDLIGGYVDYDYDLYAAVWKNHKLITLSDARLSIAVDGNDNNQFVGNLQRLDVHPALWTIGKSGKVEEQTLGSYPGTAYAINNTGQIVGTCITSDVTRAFLWQDGQIELLGNDGQNSEGVGINENGTIIGNYNTGDRSCVFVLTPGGSISLCDQADTIQTWAVGINNNGVICGEAIDASDYFVVIWQDGKLIRINDLMPGWNAYEVTSINDREQLVVRAIDPTGQDGWWLFTPKK